MQQIRPVWRASSSRPVQITNSEETVSLSEAWGQQRADASGGKAQRKVFDFISLVPIKHIYMSFGNDRGF